MAQKTSCEIASYILCELITSFLKILNIKIVINLACSDSKTIMLVFNTIGYWRKPCSLLRYYIHCYTDNSDVMHYSHSVCVSPLRTGLDLCLNWRLLAQISDRGRQNLVDFNPDKTQVCCTDKQILSRLLCFENALRGLCGQLEEKAQLFIQGE